MNIKSSGLGLLLDDATARGIEPEQRGQLMLEWFDASGGKRFLDPQRRLIIVKDGRDVTVTNNTAFDAFLMQEAGRTTKSKEMAQVIAAFRGKAFDTSHPIGQVSWLHTDKNAFGVYLHINCDDRKIIRITPTGVDLVMNGNNDESVLLARSPNMQPWTFEHLIKSDYENTLHIFDQQILQRMACSRENQLLFGCWVLAFPLIDFALAHPHLRAEGSTSLGKSTGIDLVSTFVYGSPEKVITTSAYNYAEASANPFLFFDNLEKSGMTPQIEQFLLLAATGGKKGKRIPGTVSATIREEIRCLISSTGIENLTKGELINRAIHVEFNKNKFGGRAVIAPELEQIKKQRSRFLSAHMHLVQHVLQRIEAGEMDEVLNGLDNGHFLSRANDFLALMALIASELVPVIEPRQSVPALVQSWITEQDRYGRQSSREANQIVTLVEVMLQEMDAQISGPSKSRWPYDVQFSPDGFLTGLSGHWFRSFAAVKARKHVRFDLTDTGQLTRRFKDAQPALASAGIRLDWKWDGHAKVFRFTLKRDPLLLVNSAGNNDDHGRLISGDTSAPQDMVAA
jgi:hypothetical protein